MQLKVKKEYMEIFPRMDEKTFEAFKRDIQLNGLLEPIEVLPDGTIIDGYNRYEACRQLNIEPKWVVKNFKNEIEIINYILEKNGLRRDLNVYQKAYAFFKGRELAISAQGIAPTRRISKGSLKALSRKSGIPRRTLQKCWRIYNCNIPEIKNSVYLGKWSINYGDWLVSMLEKIPEEFQEEKKMIIRHYFKNEKLLREIIDCGIAGLELLKTTKQEVAQKLKKKYRFFTRYFKRKELESLKADIEEAKGKQMKLTKVLPELKGELFPEEFFKNEEEASEYAKKFNGYCVGKKTYWVLKVDKSLYKKQKRRGRLAFQFSTI